MRDVIYFLYLAVFSVGTLSHGAIDVVAREMFEGVKTLNSTNPGNLGTWIEGAWHCRRVGPRLNNASAPGWSGDAQGVYTSSMWDLTQPPYSTAREKGMIGCWVRFESFDTAGYMANPAMILQLTLRSDNWPFQLIGLTRTGGLATRENDQWVSNATILPKTWYWFQIEWARADNVFSAKSSYQALGGSLMTLSIHTTSRPYEANRAYVMNAPYSPEIGAFYNWRGRLGAAVLAKIDAMGDGMPIMDVIPPVEERHTWYLDPVRGDDQNDGLSPDRAWKTVEKLNVESLHAGLLSPLTGGYEQGDTVLIDASSAPLDLGTSGLEIRTAGLSVKPAPGQKNILTKAFKDVSSPETVWHRSHADTHPNVWSTTDHEATDLKDVVIWQNDLWLNHPVGPSASAVMDVLNQTPGSFYSDGAVLYLHPFGSSNPNIDGNKYTRSRFRAQGRSAVLLLAQDLYVEGLHVEKTALVGALNNDPYTAYGIQGEQLFGGKTVLKNCYVRYAGKHCIGFSDSGSHRDLLVDHCQVEQGTPYSLQTPWVDYNGNAEATGNRTIYYECLNLKGAGKIGSVEGTNENITAYLCHNNGQGTQFAELQFIGGIHAGVFDTSSCIDKIHMENVKFGGGLLAAHQSTVTGCSIDQLPVTTGWSGGTLTARHNLFVFSAGIFTAGFNSPVSGHLIYEGNTLDLRPYRRTNNAYFPLFNRVTPLSFIFRNNLFIAPQEMQFNVIENAQSSDDLQFSNNFYDMAPGGFVVSRFNDGSSVTNCTLEQWQARGYDVGSRVGHSALTENYLPTRDSILKNAGVDLGHQRDFTGRIFKQRKGIGAYEPIENYDDWLQRTFDGEESEDVADRLATADPDRDGLNNVFEFALGRDPLTPDGFFQPTNSFQRSRNEVAVTLNFEGSGYITGLSWGVEVSEDLKEWQPQTDVSADDLSFDVLTGKISIQLRYVLSTEARSRLFIRAQPWLD